MSIVQSSIIVLSCLFFLLGCTTENTVPSETEIESTAQKMENEYESVAIIIQEYGTDTICPDGYLDNSEICSMFVYLYMRELAIAMKATIHNQDNFLKTSRVFDKEEHRTIFNSNKDKSLFHGLISLGHIPMRSPQKGGIFVCLRNTQMTQNNNDIQKIINKGIVGEGGHTGIVTKVFPGGFEAIQASNNRERRLNAIFRKQYSDSVIEQGMYIFFKPLRFTIYH
jgi:hypothetical protein